MLKLPTLKIHCHALGLIMTKPKEKGQLLSVGAKSHVMECAKQLVYGYKKSVNTKELTKGLIVEPDSIALLNEVFFDSFEKNTERRENAWLTGECDILTKPRIRDVKSPFSLNSFPVTPEQGEDSLYEWQMRGYMSLYDRDEAIVDYCMVDTPEELWGFDDPAIHVVSHIDPRLRVTEVTYSRDKDLEEVIKGKVEAAQEYYIQCVYNIVAAHNH